MADETATPPVDQAVAAPEAKATPNGNDHPSEPDNSVGGQVVRKSQPIKTASDATSEGVSGDEEDPPIDGFSTNASRLYYTQLNKYLVDLERFSRLKAKLSSVDGVSSQHVKEAAAFLSSSRVTPRYSRYCETLGGVFLGAGLSELLSLLQADKFSAGLVMLTALLIGVGGVLIGIFLGRD